MQARSWMEKLLDAVVAYKSVFTDHKTSCTLQSSPACSQTPPTVSIILNRQFPTWTASERQNRKFPGSQKSDYVRRKILSVNIDFLLKVENGHPARSDENEISRAPVGRKLSEKPAQKVLESRKFVLINLFARKHSSLPSLKQTKILRKIAFARQQKTFRNIYAKLPTAPRKSEETAK